MINLKYELKKEKYEEEDETIEIEIVEITAETNHPQTQIRFEKSGKLLAETLTDDKGKAVCGFTQGNRKCVIKATVGDETGQVTVPKTS